MIKILEGLFAGFQVYLFANLEFQFEFVANFFVLKAIQFEVLNHPFIQLIIFLGFASFPFAHLHQDPSPIFPHCCKNFGSIWTKIVQSFFE